MQGPFPKVETDSPEAPLPVKGGYLFFLGGGQKFRRWDRLKSATPTAQIGGLENPLQSAPVFV